MFSSLMKRAGRCAEVLVGELDAAREGLHLPHPLGRPGDVGVVVAPASCQTAVEGDVGVVLDAVGHVRPRPGSRPQFIQSMCEGASGHRLGDPPQAGQQVLDRRVGPHVVGGVAVLVRVGRRARRRRGRRAATSTLGAAAFARSRTGQVSSSASASAASLVGLSASTGPVTAISSSPSGRGG